MSSLQRSTNCKECKKSWSGLRLPADATSASRTDGLGIIDDTKRAADKLGGEIDRGASQEFERYGVYNDAGLSHGGVLKYTSENFSVPGYKEGKKGDDGSRRTSPQECVAV